MTQALLDLDRELMLYLNGHHTALLDSIMIVLTQRYTWVPLYVFLLLLAFKDYKRDTLFIIIAIVLVIVVSDQLTSGLMKPYFLRLRPSQDPSLEGLIHIVDGYKGGKYGFASSHAANTFALATFFFMLFRNTRKWIPLLFLWAVIVSYTRIYLGVHYPGDIVVGGLIGAIIGWAGYHAMQSYRLRKKTNSA